MRSSHFYHYMALAMGVIGLGVVVGAWFGRPASLVILGAVLIPVPLLPAGGSGRREPDFGRVQFGRFSRWLVPAAAMLVGAALLSPLSHRRGIRRPPGMTARTTPPGWRSSPADHP